MADQSDILHIITQRVFILDGAMGTSIQDLNLWESEFEGKTGCLDYLSLIRPDIIRRIHTGFLDAGCMGIETNSFGASRLKLADYGLQSRTIEINRRAAEIAREAACGRPEPAYVIGSIGPTGMLPSSNEPGAGSISFDTLVSVFEEQAVGLLQGGADAISIETSQDILEAKAAVIGCRQAMQSAQQHRPLIVHVTLDRNGRMLMGTEIGSALVTLEGLDIDVIGINCSTGPEEMRDAVRFLSAHSRSPLSCMPNMGLPENIDGRPVFPLKPEPFAAAMAEFVERFGVRLAGGCCGSTPAHLRALTDRLRTITLTPRAVTPLRALSSAISFVSLEQSPPPLIVGERLNAQGSRRMKSCLLTGNYDAIVDLARTQVADGAHVLDLCVALNELEDEAERFSRVAKELALQVSAPIMIDSTDIATIEQALRQYPGRIIVNSINLENGTEKIDELGDTIKRYGAYVIALTIDERGMATTSAEKTAVARRIAGHLRDSFEIGPDRIIFDPLTFTLATGESTYRTSALETLEALEMIKRAIPECLTILGVSNVSFGLSKRARPTLNSVFLYHALQRGLDCAIVNPADISPYPAIAQQERALAENLLFNKHDNALQEFITHFEEADGPSVQTPPAADLPLDQVLHDKIFNRHPEGIEALLDRLLTGESAVSILNRILLPAMKAVGDKFGSGELILPFVLQSAEVMKRAMNHLEQYLDSQGGFTKGKVVLATVYGDVHDIGKNLVKTILSNNGYDVLDLGKQVPAQTIVDEVRRFGADALGLSALLVSTSRQMPVIAQELHRAGISVPILIGGAAVTPQFARTSALLDDRTAYPAGLFYANDAFEGLRLLDALTTPEARAGTLASYRKSMQAFIDRTDRNTGPEVEARSARSPHIGSSEPPSPPFWGVKRIDDFDLDAVYDRIDERSLYRLSWGLRRMNKEQFETSIREKFAPLRRDLQEEAKSERILLPASVYGYFPCRAHGNDLVIYDPEHHDTVRATLHFPRQRGKKLIALSDYFRNDAMDVVALQLVTIGRRVSEVCEELNRAGEYTKSYFLHGLSVESTEALAEYMHERIRTELGLKPHQGKRYSHGYPACPNLEVSRVYIELLQAKRHLGVTLTSAFQFVPEQTTAAMIVHHPQAEYFSV